MRNVRDVAALALVVAASVFVNMHYVLFPVRSWDETINVKAALHPATEFQTDAGYEYSIDHPALKRYIYGPVLRWRGITSVPTPDVDYTKGQKWNQVHGHLPELRVVLPLRVTNAVVVTLTVVVLFFAALSMLGDGVLAALTVAPVIFSQKFAVGAVAYVGCDAFLIFFFALTLLVMVLLAKADRTATLGAALLLGILGGLATSAKLNGALAVVAVMCQLALANSGMRRLWRPMMAGAVSVIVFVLLNPVMRGGGLGWAMAVVMDMLERREYIWKLQYAQFTLSRAELLSRFFPWAAFAFALVAGGLVLRKKKWTGALAVWGVVLVAGTLWSVNRTYDRYFLPIEMAVFTLGGVFGWRILAEAMARAGKRTGKTAAFLKKALLPALGAGVAVAISFAFLAAWLPWGPSRARPDHAAGRKVALLARQTAGFFGTGERLSAVGSEAFVAKDTPRAPQAPPAPPAPEKESGDPSLSTLSKRAIDVVFYAAGLAFLFVVGLEVLKSKLLSAALVVPFLWADFSRGDFWLHSASDALLVMFTALTLLVWLRRKGDATWGRTLMLGILAGAALAASPRGAALVAVVAAWHLMRGGRVRSSGGRAVVALVASLAAFAVCEPLLWRLGATDTLTAVQGILHGAFSHWTARFETFDVLVPIWECVGYWGLVPLAVALLYLARGEKWAAPVAVYGALVVAGSLVGMTKGFARTWIDVQLALSVAAGLPALWLLGKLVRIDVSLEPDERIDRILRRS